MEQWVTDNLSQILGFDVPADMIQFIMSHENKEALMEYSKTLLDLDNERHKTFLNELIKRKFGSAKGSVSNTSQKAQKKKISKGKPQQDFVSMEAPIEPVAKSNENESKSKKKTKYVNLYSQEGEDAQVVLLKGRHHCDCEASKHGLINNCLNCGRIVCTQEGSGPCLYCGTLVCTNEEEAEIGAQTKSGSKLMKSLMEQERPKGWEAALELRNRLLEYDINGERRTRVTDDDSDYFNTNSVWLSSEERDKLQKYQRQVQDKKHESRRDKKMTFDFAGRQLVEEKTYADVDVDKIHEITNSCEDRASGDLAYFTADAPQPDRDVAPGVNSGLIQFDASVESSKNYSTAVRRETPHCRVQDVELQQISDLGRCLSMHQPWASLLVEGIKMHEGRTWYTNHRGRLWIASTAKPPDQDVIRAIENQYRVLYPDKVINFPSFYPTGCLLGCVNVDDCLPQEEYQKIYPEGESDSPYVFICSNPISLKLRFPIKGQHKIYSLDKTIHLAAQKCIQNVAKMQADKVKAA